MKPLLLLIFFLLTGSTSHAHDIRATKKHSHICIPAHTQELIAVNEQHSDSLSVEESLGVLPPSCYGVVPIQPTAQTFFNSLFVLSRSWQRSVATRAPPSFV